MLLLGESHLNRALSEGEALRLLLPLCFAARDVPRLDLEREFPQRLLGEMVAEVVEEGDNVVVVFEIVMSGREKV